MKKLFLIILMIILPSLTFAGSLQDKALGHAQSFVGIKEVTGHNDGPQIKKMLNYVGLSEGNPYCMSCVVYTYHLAALDMGIKDVLPKFGRVALVYSLAKQNPFKYKIVTPNSVILKTDTIQPGDISIHSRAGGTEANFNGHTGIVTRQIDNTKFEAIEGNTGAGPDQGEGEGIAIKRRFYTKMNGNLGLKGWIRIK